MLSTSTTVCQNSFVATDAPLNSRVEGKENAMETVTVNMVDAAMVHLTSFQCIPPNNTDPV